MTPKERLEGALDAVRSKVQLWRRHGKDVRMLTRKLATSVTLDRRAGYMALLAESKHREILAARACASAAAYYIYLLDKPE